MPADLTSLSVLYSCFIAVVSANARGRVCSVLPLFLAKELDDVTNDLCISSCVVQSVLARRYCTCSQAIDLSFLHKQEGNPFTRSWYNDIATSNHTSP